jgi:hypothetical protein
VAVVCALTSSCLGEFSEEGPVGHASRTRVGVELAQLPQHARTDAKLVRLFPNRPHRQGHNNASGDEDGDERDSQWTNSRLYISRNEACAAGWDAQQHPAQRTLPARLDTEKRSPKRECCVVVEFVEPRNERNRCAGRGQGCDRLFGRPFVVHRSGATVDVDEAVTEAVAPNGREEAAVFVGRQRLAADGLR